MQKAINYFHVEGTPVECLVFGHGHINYTYKVTTDTGNEYILQRINKNVFKDPESLMENVSAVSEFLRKQVLPQGLERRVLARLRVRGRLLPRGGGNPRGLL